jgi:EAL domain-containing protein (putative c-di-GMP-specific phosphodiesterase class I)
VSRKKKTEQFRAAIADRRSDPLEEPKTTPIRKSDSGYFAGHTYSTLDAPQRLVDLSTGLPSLTTLFSDLRPVAESNSGTTVLYVHLPSNELIEERFGWETLEAYGSLVGNYLTSFARDLRHGRDHCVLLRAFADDYLIAFPRHDGDEETPAALAEGMRRHLQAMDEDLASLHEVYVGLATLSQFGKIHPERRLYRGIQRAQQEATDVGRQRISAQTRLLDQCIKRRDFHLVYQRELRNPHVLFNVAEQGGRVWPLSRLLRRMAVEAVAQVPDQRLMFINIHPDDIEDPELLSGEPFVVENAARIVLEVTERATIKDFDRFRHHMDTLRQVGVRIAVDDLGSGYAALSSVAELNPDFIKFDMTLIRQIDESPIRQNLLRNMIAFAVDAGARVIGEGVETEQELETLGELGCHCVQGFYLARPAPEFLDAIALDQ